MADVIVTYGAINGTLLLGLTIGVLVLVYIAIATIIAKAGYPWVWVILPLTPFALFVACIVDLYRDLHTLAFGGSYGFLGISSIGILWTAFLISLAVNCVMFFVFAFSRWPTVAPRAPRTPKAPRASRGSKAQAAVLTSQGFSPTDMASRSSRRFPAGGPAFATNSGAVPSSPVDATSVSTAAPASTTSSVVVKRCVWCGDALPGSRALFHDCGPTDRPPVYCATCGNGLETSGQCVTCDVPSAVG
jgi:hypothetical protein